MLTPSPAAGGEDGGAIPASFYQRIIPNAGRFVNSFFRPPPAAPLEEGLPQRLPL